VAQLAWQHLYSVFIAWCDLLFAAWLCFTGLERRVWAKRWAKHFFSLASISIFCLLCFIPALDKVLYDQPSSRPKPEHRIDAAAPDKNRACLFALVRKKLFVPPFPMILRPYPLTGPLLGVLEWEK